MSSVLRSTKEATSLRRQFTVYPYFNGGVNQFFTASNGTLSRIAIDISGVDYVIARDMGAEMTITAVDSALAPLLTSDSQTPVQVVKTGTARKFQVLSMMSGRNLSDSAIPTGNMYSVDSGFSEIRNIIGNGEAYSDTRNSNSLFDVSGRNTTINDLLIVGSATTTTTSTTQSLPFGTFWAVNDPIVIQFPFHLGPAHVPSRIALMKQLTSKTINA
jgi:hypothetical protein